ncbi:hypothetical protein Y1Q_0001133 [Alligator mississippiensis]|uniref:Uncharacterized protein n=1 Tax=Alligator mississippiensis TaxID=8496 RepID=A0A151M406_ALLMI|nr:hypothetical protein Y1Q_0001133 [Alligator mississippiensis]
MRVVGYPKSLGIEKKQMSSRKVCWEADDYRAWGRQAAAPGKWIGCQSTPAFCAAVVVSYCLLKIEDAAIGNL